MSLPDTADVSTYGGSKVNFGPVEDPTTDRDATQANFAYNDVAAMTHTVTRCWARFTTSATTPTLVKHDAVWGSSLGVQPVVARTGAGVFTITWPATVTDLIETPTLGQATHTVNLRGARYFVEGATPINVTATVTSANVITVRTFTLVGAAADEAGTTLLIEGL